MTMVRRRPVVPAPAPLSPAVTRIVLAGWDAAGPDARDDDGAFRLFQQNVAGVIALWRQHEGFLRDEAKRLRIRPMWGRKFFGESLAAEARRHDAQRAATTPDDDAA